MDEGWFIFVQAMMTVSMLMSIFALLSVSVPIMHFAVRYNMMMVGLGFILECIASKYLFSILNYYYYYYSFFHRYSFNQLSWMACVCNQTWFSVLVAVSTIQLSWLGLLRSGSVLCTRSCCCNSLRNGGQKGIRKTSTLDQFSVQHASKVYFFFLICFHIFYYYYLHSFPCLMLHSIYINIQTTLYTAILLFF